MVGVGEVDDIFDCDLLKGILFCGGGGNLLV